LLAEIFVRTGHRPSEVLEWPRGERQFCYQAVLAHMTNELRRAGARIPD
jgi:hypothetical protein